MTLQLITILFALFATALGAFMAIALSRRIGGARSGSLAGEETAPLSLDASAAASVAVPELPAVVTGQSATVTLAAGDVDLCTIAPLEREEDGLREVQDGGIKHGVEALIRNLPLAEFALERAAGKLYRLKFAPEALRQQAAGNWHLVAARGGGSRAILSDGVSFRANGRVIPAGGAAAGAVVGAWQVMAIVTAQKFLADIDEKLAAIDGKLDEVKQWLEQDRRQKLVGSLSYLRHIAHAIRDGSPDERQALVWMNQLEEIERECHQVESITVERVRALAAELDALPVTKTRRFRQDEQKLGENLAASEHAASDGLIAAQVRGAACQLLACLPSTESVCTARVKDIERGIGALGDAFAAYGATAEQKIPNLKAFLAPASVQLKARARTRERLRGVRRRVDSALKHLRAESATLRESFTAGGKAAERELVVAVDAEGRVSRVLQPAGRRGLPEARGHAMMADLEAPGRSVVTAARGAKGER